MNELQAAGLILASLILLVFGSIIFVLLDRTNRIGKFLAKNPNMFERGAFVLLVTVVGGIAIAMALIVSVTVPIR